MPAYLCGPRCCTISAKRLPKGRVELWEISDRRVQALCANGQVEGIIRLKRGWLIPKGTPKPPDGRAKNGRVAVKNKERDAK